MAATLEAPPLPTKVSVGSESTPLIRRPVSFNSGDESLFGWLHYAEGTPHFRHGVVICPPIGYEHLHTHRTVRHLADELARHGIPALRFDWSGHGDSAGTDHDPDRVHAWQRNVHDAVKWMRESLSDAPVSVVGLRVGALLAATSLSTLEIENLVLWAPVFHGREFVREMKAIDYTGDAPRNPDGAQRDLIEAAGFVLTNATAKELSVLQLAAARPRLQHALLAQRDDVPVDPRFQTWVDAIEIPAEIVTVSGYADMLREPHRSTVPTEAIYQIREWLCRQISSTASDHPTMPEELHGGSEVCLPPHVEHSVTMASSTGSYREEVCWIRRAPELFGILTEPRTPIENRPTIVLLNAGSNYRVGPGRLNVTLARTFATAGFRSLRLDIQGLGDSPGCHAGQENDPYPSTAVSNVNDALQFLQERYGQHPCVVMGLCSGAYTAFQSAAQILAPAFVESILINPLTYFWRDGMTIDDDTTARELYQQQHYLKSALQPQKWWKLLTGRSRIGFAGALRFVLRKWHQRRPLEAANLSTTQPIIDGTLGHPRERNLPGDLCRIAGTGRHLSLYFAENDPGLQILHSEARAATLRHQASGQMEIHVIKHADHTFSREFARRMLIEQLRDHLNARYPLGSVDPCSIKAEGEPKGLPKPNESP